MPAAPPGPRPTWFVGLVVPAAAWLDARIGAPPPGVRRLHPDDVHVTVAYLGPVGEEVARAAWAALPPLPGPCPVTLGPVRAYGHRRRPALAVTLQRGRSEVVDLIAAARAPVLAAAGLAPDPRPVDPHATVARATRRARPAEVRAWAEGRATPGVALTLEEVALFTWADPQGARRYRAVERRRLGRP